MQRLYSLGTKGIHVFMCVQVPMSRIAHKLMYKDNSILECVQWVKDKEEEYGTST